MADTQPKFFVFALMPFDEQFNDVYKLGIKAACSDAGAYCERVDEQVFDESILERVYNQIAKADLLIAEMTGRNPNVFYEVGYAHALGKRVVLLTQKAQDIPFDLKHYPHVIYENSISSLKTELTKRVKWAINHPKEASQFFNPTLDCYINNIQLVGNPTIKSRTHAFGNPVLEIDINNSPAKSIEVLKFQVGIFSPDRFSNIACQRQQHDRDYILVSKFGVFENRILHLLSPYFELLPGTWIKLWCELIKYGEKKSKSELRQFSLRVFNQAGPVDFPFQMVC